MWSTSPRLDVRLRDYTSNWHGDEGYILVHPVTLARYLHGNKALSDRLGRRLTS
jgi:hypothetical protein